MDWLQDLLNTTSKVLVLLSGKSFSILNDLVLYLVYIKLAVCVQCDKCLLSQYLVEISRRTVVSIPCGPSALAVKEAAWGLARYAAISQVCLQFERTI